MPFVMIWDGTVSCLRCRLPFEVLDLLKTTAEKRSGSHGKALEGWSFKSVTDKQLLPPMTYANIARRIDCAMRLMADDNYSKGAEEDDNDVLVVRSCSQRLLIRSTR
jgi:hypothetical protein